MVSGCLVKVRLGRSNIPTKRLFHGVTIRSLPSWPVSGTIRVLTQFPLAGGLPGDVSAYVKDEYEMWAGDAHSCSWLSVKELVEFNYDGVMEDRRVSIDGNGGCTAEPGGGKLKTYREFLSQGYFDDLKKLQAIGAERVVFWFDN